MFAMSFGTNASAPTAFSQFLEICTGLRCIFSKALHHFRIVAVDDAVGKAVCKADAPVSYYPNGHVASCTLAAPAEKAPGTVIPAGTVVKFDAKQALQ